MLGQRISQARRAIGLTQRELGRLLGVDDTTISSWERDKSSPSYDLLVRMADIFHTSTDWLLGRVQSSCGERLRTLRKQAGLTLRQLAELSGVTEETIEKIEQGQAEPDERQLMQLASALNVRSSYLAGDSDDPVIKNQLPPELEQLVAEITSGGWTAEDVRLALRMLRLARGHDLD